MTRPSCRLTEDAGLGHSVFGITANSAIGLLGLLLFINILRVRSSNMLFVGKDHVQLVINNKLEIECYRLKVYRPNQRLAYFPFCVTVCLS